MSQAGALRSLRLEVEVSSQAGEPHSVAARVAYQLREALGLTVPVAVVEAGTLPRFEMKSRRLVVEA